MENDEQEERAEEDVEGDGANLLSTQEDNTHDQYTGKEREVLEQVRQLVITKCESYVIKKCDKCYYKVRQVLKSVTVLLKSATGITKCDDYYKARQNTSYSR